MGSYCSADMGALPREYTPMRTVLISADAQERLGMTMPLPHLCCPCFERVLLCGRLFGGRFFRVVFACKQFMKSLDVLRECPYNA